MPKHYKKRKPATVMRPAAMNPAATPAGRRRQGEVSRLGGSGRYSDIRGVENLQYTSELDTPAGARARRIIREADTAERAHAQQRYRKYRQQMKKRRQRPPLDL